MPKRLGLADRCRYTISNSMADRYWRHRRSLLGVGEALELREQQLVLMLRLEGGALSAVELARRSGVSVEQVESLLEGLDVCERAASGMWELHAPMWQRMVASHEELVNDLRNVELALRLQMRPTGRSRRAAVLEQLQAAETRLSGWDIAGARDLVARHGLSLHRLLSLVPPRERDHVRARFMLLHATTLMNAGEADRAVAAFQRWRQLGAMPRLPADSAVRLLATISAAYRMTPGGAVHAHQVLDEADRIISSNPIEPGARRRLQRWVFCIRATPFTLLEDHDKAAAMLERATDQLDGQIDEVAEVELYRIRTLLAQGRREEASVRFDEIAPRARHASLWIQGWLYRYQADVIAGGRPASVTKCDRPADVLHACLQGWIRCRSFGFQQRLLLTRVAVAQPSHRDVEMALAAAIDADRASVAEAWADLKRQVAVLHRRRHGRRPSECTCAGRGVAPCIVHALGLHESETLRHLT